MRNKNKINVAIAILLLLVVVPSVANSEPGVGDDTTDVQGYGCVGTYSCSAFEGLAAADPEHELDWYCAPDSGCIYEYNPLEDRYICSGGELTCEFFPDEQFCSYFYEAGCSWIDPPQPAGSCVDIEAGNCPYGGTRGIITDPITYDEMNYCIYELPIPSAQQKLDKLENEVAPDCSDQIYIVKLPNNLADLHATTDKSEADTSQMLYDTIGSQDIYCEYGYHIPNGAIIQDMIDGKSYLYELSSCIRNDPVCGNGEVEEGEVCDDQNLIDYDSCSNSCKIQTLEEQCTHDEINGFWGYETIEGECWKSEQAFYDAQFGLNEEGYYEQYMVLSSGGGAECLDILNGFWIDSSANVRENCRGCWDSEDSIPDSCYLNNDLLPDDTYDMTITCDEPDPADGSGYNYRCKATSGTINQKIDGNINVDLTYSAIWSSNDITIMNYCNHKSGSLNLAIQYTDNSWDSSNPVIKETDGTYTFSKTPTSAVDHVEVSISAWCGHNVNHDDIDTADEFTLDRATIKYVVDVPSECGNGVIEEGEVCDDGNTVDKDGCFNCVIETGQYTNIKDKPKCLEVNGFWVVLNSEDIIEECRGCWDDEDSIPDSCYFGDTPPAVCGNGEIEESEDCDDGNTYDVDGCSSTCTIEDGAVCNTDPNRCVIDMDDPSCRDTDEGIDQYYVKGTTVALRTGDIVGPQIDHCNNLGSLEESFCNGISVSSGPYTCPNGCDDGRCIGDNPCNAGEQYVDGECRVKIWGNANKVDISPYISSEPTLTSHNAIGTCICSDDDRCDVNQEISRRQFDNGCCKAEGGVWAYIYGETGCWKVLTEADYNEVACGNGELEGLEECDDNNLIDGDGCDSECKIELEPKLVCTLPGMRCDVPIGNYFYNYFQANPDNKPECEMDSIPPEFYGLYCEAVNEYETQIIIKPDDQTCPFNAPPIKGINDEYYCSYISCSDGSSQYDMDIIEVIDNDFDDGDPTSGVIRIHTYEYSTYKEVYPSRKYPLSSCFCEYGYDNILADTCAPPPVAEKCNTNVDEDGDGDIGCADSECFSSCPRAYLQIDITDSEGNAVIDTTYVREEEEEIIFKTNNLEDLFTVTLDSRYTSNAHTHLLHAHREPSPPFFNPTRLDLDEAGSRPIQLDFKMHRIAHVFVGAVNDQGTSDPDDDVHDIAGAIISIEFEGACGDDYLCDHPDGCITGPKGGPEQCDDGNRASGDGCSSICEAEQIIVCGNGVKEGHEECDDGNVESSDCCSSGCQEEPYTDINMNGACDAGETEDIIDDPVCGNGVKEGTEACDDGNTIDDDSCSNACVINEVEYSIDTNQDGCVDESEIAQAIDNFFGNVLDEQQIASAIDMFFNMGCE
jgi:cysteine-rich repeat protein